MGSMSPGMGTVNRTIKPRKIVLSQKVHLQSFVLSTIAAPVDGPIAASFMHSYTDKCLSRWPVFSKSNHKPFLYAVLKVQFENSLLKLG